MAAQLEMTHPSFPSTYISYITTGQIIKCEQKLLNSKVSGHFWALLLKILGNHREVTRTEEAALAKVGKL